MRTLLINDCHLGVKRQAGTTKKSREDLETWMLHQFEQLFDIDHDEVIIAGDLFDKRNVEEHIMATVIEILSCENCTIMAGNHDLGGINDYTMSSAEFVAKMSGCGWITKMVLHSSGYHLIPHLHSQQEFDHAISDISNGYTVITHCNIDNPFAKGDHSLNLSLNQIKDLDSKGVKIYAAHEHAQREFHNVTVIGNQFPSSIVDCQSGDKRCLVLENCGTVECSTVIKEISCSTWGREDYSEEYDPAARFVSIEGTCTIEEYPGIVKKVAEFRRSNPDVYIVRNGVKIEDQEFEMGDETVDQFNIVELFLGFLPKGAREKVEEKCL